MIVIDKVILTDDIMDEFFVCDLQRCKGACCEEGDLGAPLEESELEIIQKIYPKVKRFLTPEGIQEIESQGFFVKDEEGDFSTPTIGKGACAYSIRDEKGVLKCGIEYAWAEGEITFKKPISCHLYPLRTKQYEQYEAVNYHQWNICSPACQLGTSLKIPLYVFLKEPLERKYGKEWYLKLVEEINWRKKEGIKSTSQKKK
ncbi:MAG: DUF3109 family protein [Flammeovirgaceae bacterium]